MRGEVPGSEHRQQEAIRQPNFIVTGPLSQAKGWLYRPGSRLITRAISPQAGGGLESPGRVRRRFHVERPARLPLGKSIDGNLQPAGGQDPAIISRSPLSQMPRSPGTRSSASSKDSCAGSWAGRPNLRTRRTRRAEPAGHAKGSVSRAGSSPDASPAAWHRYRQTSVPRLRGGGSRGPARDYFLAVVKERARRPWHEITWGEAW